MAVAPRRGSDHNESEVHFLHAPIDGAKAHVKESRP
jgi:hypothetical protein